MNDGTVLADNDTVSTRRCADASIEMCEAQALWIK